MRFAEVFLRLGSALVAWMMLYAHMLWLAASRVMGCGPDGDELHLLLLGLAPFACGFAFLLQATRPFNEIQRMLRWLSAPLVLLLPFALAGVWTVFKEVSLQSTAICTHEVPVLWQQIWAPVQLITVSLVVVMVVRVWRSAMLDGQKYRQ